MAWGLYSLQLNTVCTCSFMFSATHFFSLLTFEDWNLYQINVFILNMYHVHTFNEKPTWSRDKHHQKYIWNSDGKAALPPDSNHYYWDIFFYWLTRVTSSGAVFSVYRFIAENNSSLRVLHVQYHLCGVIPRWVIRQTRFKSPTFLSSKQTPPDLHHSH